MAHGFGLMRAAGLWPFAERFVAAGYAVHLFDYRGFGDSDGEPRQVGQPAAASSEDWAAAGARALVAAGRWPARGALGHVLFGWACARRPLRQTPGVRAVIAQVPHVAAATLRQGPYGRPCTWAWQAFAIWIGGWFGRPFYSRVVGHPGDVAAMTSADPGTDLCIFSEDAHWPNKTRARVFLELAFYSPMRHTHKIKARRS